MAKEIVAMILAGGRGSRLYALTQKTAKPAVGFGGKYRIVDFPLSNCVNSNIDTVGIATQYQPQKLNEYIGNGQPWDLDRLHGGAPGGGLPFGGGAVYFSSCFCTACTMRAIAALRAALTANSTRKFTPMNATNRK